jgi:hypothetical protein
MTPWTHEESIETTASPARVWSLLADVAGWKRWNAGIERIEIHGPFVAGTKFSMQPPGQEPFESTLISVTENGGFTDETVVGDTRVLVHHRIEARPSGGARVVYRTEITGPDAAEFGPFVTADFPQVLAGLCALAESA